MIKWKTLIEVAMTRREEARKSQSGPQPRYRQLLGALVLMSMKNLNYRDVEDQIANYVPARYLCNLLDSTWTPDHGTIFHFAKMLGAQGIKHLNDEILLHAQTAGLANPQELMSDTTAQEARIPYPNEAGLMNRFMTLIGRGVGRLRGGFDAVKKKVVKAVQKTKGLLRNAHLFAKGREQKRKIERKMYHTVREIQKVLENAINSGANMQSKAAQELAKVNGVMKDLLPQIKHFLTTGFVGEHHVTCPRISSNYVTCPRISGSPFTWEGNWTYGEFINIVHH